MLAMSQLTFLTSFLSQIGESLIYSNFSSQLSGLSHLKGVFNDAYIVHSKFYFINFFNAYNIHDSLS